ncbi:MAG: SMC-Scp complex subunit ScpB [Atopobiaceae bacterium]|jgi:segregation and condensation protein B|nr:SMC-Scp complex subunit ScpB [Atopobiaceae bacterium]
MADLEKQGVPSLKGALEALLLVSSEAVAATDLARALDEAPGDVEEALVDLSAEYAEAERGFQLREVAGGWRLFTHPAYHEHVKNWVLSWDRTRLSQAALETLSVIVYHQPVTREEVRAVRGVNSDGVIASLVEKGLVREVGHGRAHGQAILYGTTKNFLERFGLKSLRDLPPFEEFAPDEQAKQFIRERLSGKKVASTLDAAAEDVDEGQEDRELLEDGVDEQVEEPSPNAQGDDGANHA